MKRNLWQRIFGPRPDTGDRLMFMPAGLLDRIRPAAQAAGITTIQYAHEAIHQRIERETK